MKKIFYSALILLLLFFGLSQWLRIGNQRIEYLASYILHPFLRAQKAIAQRFHEWSFHRTSARQIAAELERYHELHEKLQQEVIELRSLINLKELTQDLRPFLERYKTDYLKLTQVLFKQFDKHHFFLIDAGSQQGVSNDMIAVYKDCLIGRVTEVYPYYSKVVLITDPTCKVAAICTDSAVKGIHEGTGSLRHTKLSFIAQPTEFKKDDLIISSGEGLLFPRGFGLGRMKEWEWDGYNCNVTVEPIIDLKKIEFCHLIQKGAELKTNSSESSMP